MTCRKINRIHHKLFDYCNVDVPGGKVLHLERTLGMNYAKDNDVDRPDTHSRQHPFSDITFVPFF